MIKLLAKTDQEALTMSYLGLMRQGVKGVLDTTCVYYGGEGIACGIGHLMSESDRENLQSNVYGNMAVPHLIEMDMVDPGELSVSLLKEIQFAHDAIGGMRSASGSYDFKSELNAKYFILANKFNLELPEYEHD